MHEPDRLLSDSVNERPFPMAPGHAHPRQKSFELPEPSTFFSFPLSNKNMSFESAKDFSYQDFLTEDLREDFDYRAYYGLNTNDTVDPAHLDNRYFDSGLGSQTAQGGTEVPPEELAWSQPLTAPAEAPQLWGAPRGGEVVNESPQERQPPIAIPPPDQSHKRQTGMRSTGGSLECPFQGCRSKAQFHTHGLLYRHIQNIHWNPLLCTVSGCKHQKPFGKQSDLDRHVASVHDGGRHFVCPDETCPAHANGFKRQDKLRKHIKESHTRVRCSLSHGQRSCSDIIYDFELEKQVNHMKICHGDFECAVESCEFAPASRFTDWRMFDHLLNDHKMDFMLSSATLPYLEKNQLTTVRPEHLLACGVTEWKDRPHCAPNS